MPHPRGDHERRAIEEPVGRTEVVPRSRLERHEAAEAAESRVVEAAAHDVAVGRGETIVPGVDHRRDAEPTRALASLEHLPEDRRREGVEVRVLLHALLGKAVVEKDPGAVVDGQRVTDTDLDALTVLLEVVEADLGQEGGREYPREAVPQRVLPRSRAFSLKVISTFAP